MQQIQLWNAVGNMIDRNEFYSILSAECAKIVSSYENYHMETAFENANEEWAMLVAGRILKWYDDDIPLDATIIMQENETILIYLSTCRLYRHQMPRIL